MTRLCDHLLQVLGKRIDCPEFAQLIKSVGEPSKVHEVNGTNNRIYEFYHSGFGVVYSKKQEKIIMISVEYFTPNIKRGFMTPFPEELYYGIIQKDGPGEIEKKLNVKATSLSSLAKTNRYRGTYKVHPYTFDCLFQSSKGPLEGMTVYLSFHPNNIETV